MLLLSPRFAVCLWLLAAVCDAGRNKKVRLADVSTLTLSSAKQTQTKLPQLLCDYGCNAKKGAVVNQAQCKSQGLDDMGDVQWECDALMPKGCRFVETEVKCEMVDDDHIVPGSCLLQYALECDRVHASSREETELRQSIVRQKTKMQQATATEANRIKTQAAQDNCELVRKQWVKTLPSHLVVLEGTACVRSVVWLRAVCREMRVVLVRPSRDPAGSCNVC